MSDGTQTTGTSLAEMVLRERQGRLARRLDDLGREQGRSLFNGKWMKPGEIAPHYERLRKGSLMIIGEVLGLCVAMVLLAGLSFVVLAVLAGLGI